MKREIGGYMELGPYSGPEYHASAIRFNSARNAFAHAIQSTGASRVWMPRYICDALPEAANRAGAQCVFYDIDERLEPAAKIKPGANDALVFVNYFGVKDAAAHNAHALHQSTIIDCSQSFYFRPQGGGAMAFYSPRKFFGVPDGGYLYADGLRPPASQDRSFERCAHLLKRADIDAASGYAEYQENELRIAGLPVLGMSNLTRALLRSVDYEAARARRSENFRTLHSALAGLNRLGLDPSAMDGPMVYPLWASRDGLRDYLIERGVFVPKYWAEVLARADKASIEADLVKRLVALPIDQRYNSDEMRAVIGHVMDFMGGGA